MAADEGRNVERFVAPPPGEPDISLPGRHEMRIRIALPDDKSIERRCSLRSTLFDYLNGCGRVEMEYINIRYVCTRAGQQVGAGLTNASAEYSAAQVGMMPGNFRVFANAMNVGDIMEKKLMIPGNLSKQIQPVSSLLPDFAFYIIKDAAACVLIEFVLTVYGPVIHNDDVTSLK